MLLVREHSAAGRTAAAPTQTIRGLLAVKASVTVANAASRGKLVISIVGPLRERGTGTPRRPTPPTRPRPEDDRSERFCRQREAAASANAKAGTTSTDVATELAMKQLSCAFATSAVASRDTLRSRLNVAGSRVGPAAAPVHSRWEMKTSVISNKGQRTATAAHVEAAAGNLNENRISRACNRYRQ